MAAIVGVPQLFVRYVVDGGSKFTNTVGAEPVMLVAGLEVAVPPLMVRLVPPAPPGSTNVVTSVNVVDPASTAAVVCMYSPVYGELALFN